MRPRRIQSKRKASSVATKAPIASSKLSLEDLTGRAMALRAQFAKMERRKLRRVWTRADIMAGFVVDVGDLMRLVMAKDGLRTVPDLDRKLAHELADCLWSVLVLARLHNIDLEREFLHTMAQLEARCATRGQVKSS